MKAFALLCAAIGLVSASPTLKPRTPPTCNGSPDICNRKYSNVSYIGTHDSPFVGSIVDPAVNQEMSVTGQLDAGIRMLTAQTQLNLEGVLSVCHTSCMLEDAGTFDGYLSTLKSWLDANPDGVITLLLVNGDFSNVTLFGQSFEATGLNNLAFIPSTSPNTLAIDDWPTYGELIANGTRILVFMDYDADESQVPYILPEFNYFFETPYDVTTPDFPDCSLNRPPGGQPEGLMYIVNHFLDTDILSVLIPDDAADYQTNAATGPGSIGAQVAICEQNYGRPPNFVLVDMFNRGDVFGAQSALNGYS